MGEARWEIRKSAVAERGREGEYDETAAGEGGRGAAERGDEGQGKDEAGEERTEDATLAVAGDSIGAEKTTGEAIAAGDPTEAAGIAAGGKGASGTTSRMEAVSWLAGTADCVAGSSTAVGEPKDSAERGSTGQVYPALWKMTRATSGLQQRIVPSTKRWICAYISC